MSALRRGGVRVKKILHIISDSNIGGAGRYLLTYLENCDTQNFDVGVVIPVNSKLKPEIEKLGFKFHEIEGLAEKSFSKIAVKSLKKLFYSLKPDIVHAHACLSARVAAKLCGVKAVFYTRHSVFPQSKKLTNPIGRMINGFVGGILADGIISVADAARQNLLETGISDKKIRVIYNGVNPLKKADDDEKIKIREGFGITADCKVVSIIARLEEVKGHEYFIDAAKLVADKGYNAKFIIAGTGSREELLKQYAKDKNAENVMFLGFVKNVSDLENITDIQANASFGTEAASLSLLEGMSIGVPAVVSDFGGNPELIKNDVNGYVVPKQNAVAMADAIVKILDDDALYSKLSDGAVREFNSRFTAEIMTLNMEKYYNDILEGRK